jgi:hypothetical protein
VSSLGGRLRFRRGLAFNVEEGSYECDLKFDLLATQRGTEQSRFMTPSNIVRWLRVSAKTLEPQFWPFDHWPNGCLPIKRLKMRGIAVKSAR